jgi:type I site-specific restriction endonuclease
MYNTGMTASMHRSFPAEGDAIRSISHVERAHDPARGNVDLRDRVGVGVGMDREAAKGAFAEFIAGKTLTANQLEFMNMIIDHLTEHGSMSVALLYSSPYTDFSPRGVDGVFGPALMIELLTVLHSVRTRAAA